MSFGTFDQNSKPPKKSKPSKSSPSEQPVSPAPGQEEPKEYPVDTPRPVHTDYD